MYVTAGPGKSYQEKDAVLSDWHDGAVFRIYEHERYMTCNDVLRARMAGFTHVCFVWQDKDMQVQCHDLELK
jgi:hypothetical protein